MAGFAFIFDAGARAHRRKTAIVLVAALLGAALPIVLTSLPVDAAVRDPFDAVFSTEDNGAIVLIGNGQMTCPTATSGCTAARSSAPSTGVANSALNNNSYAMQFVDADASSATTNSTSATLSLPAGSTVLHARLVWGGRQAAGTGGVAATGNLAQVKFQAPGQSAYSTLTGTVVQPGALVGTDAAPYQASIDVTTQVQAAGNGTYWVGDIRAGTGDDRYAGWSLVIAFRNPSLPLRNLAIFEGFADVTTSGTNNNVTIPVSGFLTPTTGTVSASVGFVTWEGDRGLIGETVALNGTQLSDPVRPANNFFNSGITDGGANITTRSPNDANNFGFDFGRINANGVLPNASTSTTVALSTNADFYYPGVITTQIDLFTPAFSSISKTVVDLNGNDPAKVGDTLEYQISFTNTGADPADLSVITDVIAANQTYVPGSLVVTASPNAGDVGTRTDAAGDDVAEYDAATRTIRVRAGTGATASTGGTLAPNQTETFRFRVTLDRPSAGTTIANNAALAYRARTIGRNYTFIGNTVTTPVQPIADMAITKSSTPTSQTAGSAVTYTLNATNNGPNAATGVAIVDTLPAGLAFTGFTAPAGVTCTAAGQTVTCPVGTVANGASVGVTITATIAAGRAAGTVVNQASVTSTTADDVPSNSTASASTAVTTAADLVTTKVVNPPAASTAAGANITYSLGVTNNGPSDAANVVLTDALPAGATLVGATPSACTASSGTLTCAVGTLAAGASFAGTLTLNVASAYAGASLGNTATASAATTDPTPANNSATAVQSITRQADVSIANSANPTTAIPGTSVTYTLTATNSGPSSAANVVISDPAFAGATIVSASASRGSCTVSGGAASCPIGTLDPGATVTVTVLATIDPARTTTVANQASISTTTADTNAANNNATASVSVTPRADLALAKTGPAQIVANVDDAYTLQVTNLGPSVATGVTITDPLPTGLTFVSSPSGCTAAGQTVTCPIAGSIAPGATASATFTFHPDAALTGDVTNGASVASATTDPAGTNNAATYTSSATGLADVRLTKATSPGTLTAGQAVSYTLVATNAGPSQANAVTVTDTLPAGIAFVSATVDGGPGCTFASGTVTCALGAMSSSGATATHTIVINGTVSAAFTPGSTSNTATAASTTPADPTLSNNSATSSAPVVADADLRVTLTPPAAPVVAGTIATYQLLVENLGPSTARNAVVTGQTPPGLTPIVGSSGGACVLTGQTVTCNLGTLPPGASIQIPLQATVNADTPAGPIPGQAIVGSSTPDSVPANNTSTAIVDAITRADMQITQTVSPTPLVAGGDSTYTLTATNNGPSDAVNATVTDTLPANVTVLSATASLGGCTVTGQTVTCTAPRVPTGASMGVTILVRPASNATGTIDNTATVTNDVTDPVPANNTSTSSTPLTQTATLTVTKAASPQSVDAGAAITYTLTLTNAGPSDAAATTLTDALPSGLVALLGGITTSAGTCTTNAGRTQIDCSFGTVAAATTRTVTITALVPASTPPGTTITNTAVAASPTSTQPVGARTGTAVATTTVSADLSVVITGADGPEAGSDHGYLISVTNVGPSIAGAVVITNALPPNTTFVSAVSSVGTCALAGTDVTCSAGDLAPGAIVTVQVVVHVDADQGSTALASTASVTSAPASGTPTPDPVSANNTSTVTEPVTVRADLALQKSITSGPIIAGQTVTYSLVATNNGPSDTTDLVITDRIPAGTTTATATASASDDGTCQIVNGVASCRWPAVTVGAQRTMTLVVAVPADAVTGATISNTANASSGAIDPTSNVRTVDAAVSTSADLAVTKTLLSGTPIAGGPVQWQVVVRNNGPSAALDVSIDDPAPSGVGLGGATATQGSCAIDGRPGATCALGTLPVNATATVTIDGTLSASFPDGSLVNTVTATTSTPDPNVANNAATSSTTTASSADLSVTKTADSPQFVAGATAAWTITVHNDGPSSASGVLVTDPVPAGVSGVTATLVGGGAGDCTTTAGTVSCTVGTVAVGADRTIHLTGTISADYVTPAIENTASVASSTPDPDALDNGSTAPADVVTRTDLSISQAAPATAAPGETVTWTVRVDNLGPSTARAVAITDVLPADLLGVSVTFAGAACSIAGNEAVCQVGNIAPGDGVDIVVIAQVDPASVLASISNVATVTSSTTEVDQSNNSSTAVTALAPEAALTIDKVATVDPMVPGQSVGWTATISNDGPSVARSVLVTDSVPTEVSGLTATLVGGAPGDCTITGQDVTCTIAEIAPGVPRQVVITGTLDGDVVTDVANTAEVSSPTDPTDGADESITAVAPAADVSIGKDVVDAIAGGQLEYAITVRNDGPSTAQDVQVADILPADVDPASWAVDLAACSVTGGVLSCALGDLADGDVVTIALTGDIDAGQTDPIVNTATVTSPTADPNPADNTSTATALSLVNAALSIDKSAPAGPLDSGEPITWTLTVHNDGPANATDVQVFDPVPAGVGAVQATIGGVACSPAPTTVQCDLGTVPPNGDVVVTISGTIDPSYTGATLENSATVTASSPDPAGSDNSDRTTTAVEHHADLEIRKVVNRSALVPGNDALYTIEVENTGPSDATGVFVQDTLPAGLSPNGPATVSPGSCTYAGVVLGCTLGVVPAGATILVSVPVNVDSSLADAAVTNVATVTSATPSTTGTAPTPATSTTPVTPLSDLTLDKTGPSTVRAGDPITWTITVANAGPSVATDVIVTDELPANVGDVTLSPSQGSCTRPTGSDTITCTVGSLAVGAVSTVTVSLVGAISADFAPGPISNSATVASAAPEPPPNAPDDGRADVAITDVQQEADLFVRKDAAAGSATPGAPFSWTITVGNNGPSAAPATVTDVLPSELVGATVTFDAPSGVTCVAATGACTIPSLLPGLANAAVIELSGTIDPATASTSIDNAVDVTSAVGDPDPGNNSAATSTPLAPDADLAITKTAGTPEFVRGATVSWGIEITNTGPSLARDVVLTDLVPPGVTGVGVAVDPPAAATCDTTVSCDLGDLPADPATTITITVTGTLDAAYVGATVVNSATVTSATPDADPTDDSAGTTTPVTSLADLAITKVGPATAVAGSSIAWTITVHNDGPSVAPSVQVQDLAPSVISSPLRFTPSVGSCTGTTCNLGAIGVGADVTIGVTATVAASTTAPSLVNTASVTTAATDPDTPTGPNTANATTTLSRSAAVSITKSVTPDPLVPGRPATFTLDVTNAGPSTAANTHVTDTVPTGLVVGTVTTDVGACTVTGQLVDCDLAELPVPGTAQIAIPVSVPAGFGASAYSNTASVTSATPDPDGADNTSQVGGTAAPAADLAVTMLADRTAVLPGDTITWSLAVADNGPSDAGVTLTDTLPAGVTVASITPTNGGTCSAVVAGAFTCSWASIPSGGGASVSIVATVTQTSGTIDNSAVVAPVGAADPSSADNAAAVSTPVTATADLSVTKVVASGGTTAGGGVTWRVTVANSGPGTAVDARLVDLVPAGVAGITAAPSAGACTVTTTVACALGDIASGAQRTVDITGTIDPGLRGPLTNSASAAASNPDPNAANDAATASSTVIGVADLRVDKTVDRSAAEVGSDVTFTITATNAGPSASSGVRVSESLPAQMALRSATPSLGQFDAANGTWDIGALAPGATATLLVVVTLNDVGTATNSVAITGSDQVSAPGTASDAAQVAVSAATAPPPPPTDPPADPPPPSSPAVPPSALPTLPTLPPPPIVDLPGTGSDSASTTDTALQLLLLGFVLVTIARRRRARRSTS